MSGADRPDEFETIARLLRPLATDPAARGLLDDAAVLTPQPGRQLVLTHDTLVEGVHFLASDPPGTVAQKLLRTNLSDLAAKGAEPFGYLMSTAWSPRCDWTFREAFAAGLAEDQGRFGLSLLGGDTVSTPGPLTVGATLLGWGEPSRCPSRSGARAGDLLFVSGPIGDGLLGLKAALGELDGPRLLDHYRRPEPRLDLIHLARAATASADVSDGLIADAGRIAEASGLGVRLDLAAMPVSAEGRAWLDGQPDEASARLQLATGGDDYQLLLAAAPGDAARFSGLTQVGVFEGEAVEVVFDGAILPVARAGWRHG
ncbi:thiamine-phosphate kinase [Brevundimonas sp.]|uniref:thiamine-phosphate kinase n=1 Tax=Brevundimonas sp. TaxID=1871086 RepID=UPI0025ECD54E|nr:thiamine-phosphate kinase [Brevundimonas sp.]